MKDLLLTAAWVALGVVLWLRAMRLYGPKLDATGHLAATPIVRLGFHILFAPFLLAVIVGKRVWDVVDETLGRFAEWHHNAPPPDDAE